MNECICSETERINAFLVALFHQTSCHPEVIIIAANDWLNYNNTLALTTRGLILSASTTRLMYLLCCWSSAAENARRRRLSRGRLPL